MLPIIIGYENGLQLFLSDSLESMYHCYESLL